MHMYAATATAATAAVVADIYWRRHTKNRNLFFSLLSTADFILFNFFACNSFISIRMK